jgi:serine/threonine protein kinase
MRATANLQASNFRPIQPTAVLNALHWRHRASLVNATSWNQARQLLEEASARPRAERDAFLRLRCPTPEIRSRIESYLKHLEQAPDFLETVTTVLDVLEPTEPPQAWTGGLGPGVSVGPYVLVDRLGAGGMGEVFLANDVRLQRKVALKCLFVRSEGDLGLRIIDEARAAARITHPNVAMVHDVIDHDGRAFLVMEYVQGESLADRLRRERLPIERAIAIGRQLASALAAAHAHGITHRDLKPANVQITPEGVVKVLDFGVAQAISAAATGAATDADRTRRPTPRAGTPAYMSPEQLMGRPVDHRSDIYSLGIVLFEMTTGHRPYSTSDPFELVMALSKRLLRADADDPLVPRELGDVIAKALALSRDERFQTASELEAALAALERGHEHPVVAPVRPAPRESVGRWLGRIFAIAGLAMLVVGGLGFLMSAAFNVTFGRTGAFGSESPLTWLVMGLRSLLTTLLVLIVTTLLVSALGFVVRMLRLSPRIDRLLTTSRTQARRFTVNVGLDDPTVAAQALAAVGVLAMAGVVWWFRDLIFACLLFINDASPAGLLMLGPQGQATHMRYRLVLALVIIVLGLGVTQIVQLRARHGRRGGAAALAVSALVFVSAVVLDEFPYRILYHNDVFERLDYAGLRCYQIGEHADDLLVYCPDAPRPHNRVVKRSDPAVRRTGITESVFAPPDARRPQRPEKEGR